ncbi:hypothetical protein [Marinobacter sp.]|uniref:hypothetical protein n=1 Tax=Marinobacter sp. TaxID=50741 RepID=UPI0034A591C4
MFSHDKNAGAVVCLADYGRIQRGAVVPVSNELYADVEDWMAEGNALVLFEGHPDTRSLKDVRDAKLHEINDAYQVQMQLMLDKYPQAETLTFDKQEREAREYQAWVDADEQGDPPVTPLISNLAEGRQMPKAELVTRIIAKSDAWIVESGHATGKRQYLEDRVAKAETADEVSAINW